MSEHADNVIMQLNPGQFGLRDQLEIRNLTNFITFSHNLRCNAQHELTYMFNHYQVHRGFNEDQNKIMQDVMWALQRKGTRDKRVSLNPTPSGIFFLASNLEFPALIQKTNSQTTPQVYNKLMKKWK